MPGLWSTWHWSSNHHWDHSGILSAQNPPECLPLGSSVTWAVATLSATAQPDRCPRSPDSSKGWQMGQSFCFCLVAEFPLLWKIQKDLTLKMSNWLDEAQAYYGMNSKLQTLSTNHIWNIPSQEHPDWDLARQRVTLADPSWRIELPITGIAVPSSGWVVCDFSNFSFNLNSVPASPDHI